MDKTVNVFKSTVTWRKSSMDLKGHLLHMLEKGIQSDMTFLVGDNEVKESIPAHRFVLTLWSKEFERIPDEVEIATINGTSVRAFLKYLYTEDFDVSADELVTVLCLAKRFDIPALAAKCISGLKSEIKENTAVSMYQAAKLLCEDSLAEESLNYILKNGDQVIQDEDFLDLYHENLYYILERDDFEVKEIELFWAICRWATKECEKQDLEQTPENQRLVLRNVVKLVRFTMISSEDFHVHVAPSGILTASEVIGLSTSFRLPAAKDFVDRKRKISHSPTNRIVISSPDLPGLKPKLLSMFENQQKTDVTMVVGENKEKFLAHKFILKLWSPVFERMLGMWWQKETKEQVVEITSCDARAFRNLLKFLYTEQLDESFEEVMSVCFIAKAYDVACLEEKCVDLLNRSVGDNTAISIFQAAKKLNDETLADISWKYVLRRGFAVVKELDFLNISYNNLCNLVEQDELNIEEVELFQSILRWASHQCDKEEIPKNPENLRMVLKKVITLIRFPLMSIKDFSVHVVPTRLVSDIGIGTTSCTERNVRTLD